MTALTHRVDEDASERPPEQAVDDEITRRVEDDQNVADLRVVEVKSAAGSARVLAERPEDLVQQSGGLTHNEDADDCDYAHRDIVTFAACRRISATNNNYYR